MIHYIAVLSLAGLSVVLTLAGAGDLYFEQTTVLRSEGASSAGVRSRVWCSGRRLRLEPADAPGGPALLLLLDEGRVLRLDPESRTATQLDSDRLRARSAADAAVAAGLMGNPGEELRTTPLPGSRTIAGQPCRGFRIAGPSFVVETWTTPGLAAGSEAFADFLEWSGAAQALSGLVDAIRALPGFPMETRMRVNVLGETKETVSTVTLVRAAPVPRERFEVPPGWRLVVEQRGAAEAKTP